MKGNRRPWAHPLLTISQRRCRLRAITTIVGWTRYPPGLKEKSRPSQVTFSRCLHAHVGREAWEFLQPSSGADGPFPTFRPATTGHGGHLLCTHSCVSLYAPL